MLIVTRFVELKLKIKAFLINRKKPAESRFLLSKREVTQPLLI